MLTERYSPEELLSVLLPVRRFRPFPTADDRPAWEAIPDRLRTSWLREGEAFLGYRWPSLLASDFLAYARTGSRHYDSLYQLRRAALGCLVVCECLEGKGRFLDDIANGVFVLCEETSWCLPAHMSLSRGGEGLGLADPEEPVVDLFAADTGALLAWTAYLLQDRLDRISPLVCRRIRQEVGRRILVPYETRSDFWWMGFAGHEPNNWNPWCHSNVLAAVLLLEEDEGRRVRLTNRIMSSLDRYLAVQYPDGGCDEGPTYWNVAAGSLFDCLELLYMATDGAVDLYDRPLIRQLGQYIAKVSIHGAYYVNFADGSAEPRLDYALIYRYGRRIGDPSMTALGLSGMREAASVYDGGHIFFLFRELAGIGLAAELERDRGMAERESEPEPAYELDGWLDRIQVMTARERSDRMGLYLAVKGGHNGESHNHNDIGQFVVYADGEPFLIDVGVENYSARTFGPGRYDIWTMQSGYHNLPAVNGYDQTAGKAFRAREVIYEADENGARMSLDLAGAYPPEAGLRQWRRTVALHRGPNAFVELTERCLFSGTPESVVLNWMTCGPPDLSTDGVVRLPGKEGRALRLEYDAKLFSASAERIDIRDSKLRAVWGDRLYRIRMELSLRSPSAEWIIKIRQGEAGL
ncbi:heparinase II/III domain-containing protein [Cohnella nanjingensis]|uniref:Heparinase II/III family protein n=1 Tax=Cohnella nanjingensis TaxID=1387779 RepID=A0A7X0RQN0_9BACL|nr:heparinase II/III family protein [Cohnella nanjingensis]MBB6671867.1 heparinase II/III family protein [Cohnella nanjingensis]